MKTNTKYKKISNNIHLFVLSTTRVQNLVQ